MCATYLDNFPQDLPRSGNETIVRVCEFVFLGITLDTRQLIRFYRKYGLKIFVANWVCQCHEPRVVR